MQAEKLAIADEIRRQILFIGVCRFLTFGLLPNVRNELLNAFNLKTENGYGIAFPFHKKGHPKKIDENGNETDDEDYFMISGNDAFEYADANPAMNIDFLNIPISNALVKIGDLLKQHGYFEKTPELEFLRHLRNAMAHNNKLTFTNREPVRPARFKQYNITKADENTPVLQVAGQPFYLALGDVMELFELIESQLRH